MIMKNEKSVPSLSVGADMEQTSQTTEKIIANTEPPDNSQILPGGKKLKLINMADIKPEKVEWLFYPFIPLRKVTIIQGDPGEGKTTVLLHLMARLTKGEPLVDFRNSTFGEPINIVFQTAEDGLADTIRPRLDEADADCLKVDVIDDSEDPLTMLDERIEASVIRTGARLVVLDPIQAYLGSDVDMHRANEIRPVMKHLAVIAEKYNCAIVLIGHMNKCAGNKGTYRGLGSIDFTAAARSVILCARVKDEPEKRVLIQSKSSLAPEEKPIAFSLTKERGFEWIGEYDITESELLSGETKGRKLRNAKTFLEEQLAAGTKSQKELEEAALKQGIRSKTLRNAKQELEIDSIKIGNKWYWNMKDQDGKVPCS